MKLINQHNRPITLDGGLILAAAGTAGSIHEVDSISERDRRRYVDSGRIAIGEDSSATRSRKAEAKEESK